MVKIIVNGREVEADPKKPLIKACHDNGADVPMYCYHPGLEPVGSCRICQVEVKQGDAPARVMVACRTQPAEGWRRMTPQRLTISAQPHIKVTPQRRTI